jgi:hypothetical protein
MAHRRVRFNWLAALLLAAVGLAQAQDLISATGLGRPPADSASPAQAYAMAERAAFLQAVREAANKAGRQPPLDYAGPIKVGAVIRDFRITRITRLPDGSVQVEVSVPRSRIAQ